MPRFGELKMHPGPAWGRGCWNLTSARFPAQPGPLAAPPRIAPLGTKFWRTGRPLREPDSPYGSCSADSSLSPGWGGRSLCRFLPRSPAWWLCLTREPNLVCLDAVELVWFSCTVPCRPPSLQAPEGLVLGQGNLRGTGFPSLK